MEMRRCKWALWRHQTHFQSKNHLFKDLIHLNESCATSPVNLVKLRAHLLFHFNCWIMGNMSTEWEGAAALSSDRLGPREMAGKWRVRPNGQGHPAGSDKASSIFRRSCWVYRWGNLSSFLTTPRGPFFFLCYPPLLIVSFASWLSLEGPVFSCITFRGKLMKRLNGVFRVFDDRCVSLVARRRRHFEWPRLVRLFSFFFHVFFRDIFWKRRILIDWVVLGLWL